MSATSRGVTRQDLERCERELMPLVPNEWASAYAREDARAFAADVSAARDAVLEPFRGLLEKGDANPELGACVLKTVAELAFWRRVLEKVHQGQFRTAATSPDFLVSYLLS